MHLNCSQHLLKAFSTCPQCKVNITSSIKLFLSFEFDKTECCNKFIRNFQEHIYSLTQELILAKSLIEKQNTEMNANRRINTLVSRTVGLFNICSFEEHCLTPMQVSFPLESTEFEKTDLQLLNASEVILDFYQQSIEDLKTKNNYIEFLLKENSNLYTEKKYLKTLMKVERIS